METGSQGLTVTPVSSDQIAAECKQVPVWQAKEVLLDFIASDGIGFDQDGNETRLNMGQLALMLGYSRQTLYNWMKADPEWELKLAKRMVQVWGGGRRIGKVWRGIYEAAKLGKHEQATMFLSHFSNYKPPAQKIENEITIAGFADLVQQAQEEGIIDVTDDSTPALSSGSGENNPQNS